MELQDNSGHLTTQQRETIADAIEAKGAARACQRCERPDFEIADSLVSLTAVTTEGDTSTKALPCVVVMCTNCGHVVLHHIARLGVQGKLDG